MGSTSHEGGPESVRTRDAFNTVAGLYDRYRNGYPKVIVDQMVDDARIGLGSEVLEIGPGTGQVTRHLLELGARVTAVELGEALAALARRNLARFPHFEVVVSAFEDWPLPDQRFHAVLAATSFHWLDPEIRAPKCAQALAPGGTLLAVYPHHVRGVDDSFARDTQTCYLKWGLSADPEWRLPLAETVPRMYQDIEGCSDFGDVARRRVRCTVHYATDGYVGLLSTDSLILSLSPQDQEGFLADIRALVDSRYGGRVARDYLYEIVAARKRV